MNTLRKILDNCNTDIEVLYDEAMSRHTSLHIGGIADALVFPHSAEALSCLLERIYSFSHTSSYLSEEDVIKSDLTIIGGGSNILVSDSGIRGIVISTEKLRNIAVEDNMIYAEAGIPSAHLSKTAAKAGLSGLEFASGLPGSVGGAIYMNARCYGSEFSQILEYIDCIEKNVKTELTTIKRVKIDTLEWDYKKTPFMPGGSLENHVILGAGFYLRPGSINIIKQKMKDNEADRKTKGHFDYPSAGSMFKNNRDFGKPTGAILESLGFKGKRIGDAMVNPKHANIFVNAGNASAKDMLSLINEAKAAAKKEYGYNLELEPVLLGNFV